MGAVFNYGGTKPLDLDEQLDNALARMNGDPVGAANLFLRWAESNSEIADLIPNVIANYIVRRMKVRAKEMAKK
jgi:hypothetical protein